MATVLAIPVAANAATTNQTANRAALKAYATYLQSLVKGLPKGKAADTAFVKSTSKCRGAVAAVKSSRYKQDVHLETTYDAAIAFQTEAGHPARKLSTTLTKLKWSTRSVKATIHTFSTSLQKLLKVKASNICGDALDLSTKTTAEPAGTKAEISAYATANHKLSAGFHSFAKVLFKYQTAKDSSLVTRIDKLANKYEKDSAGDFHAAAAKAWTALT